MSGTARLPQGWLLEAAVAAVCALVGFLLVAQVRATEGLGERLAGEREEDLARILADLTAESDRLSEEITSLRLTLLALEDDQRGDEAARASLRQRLDDLRILAGTAEAVGPGLELTIVDPQRRIAQDDLVDTVQELRDAGAEAISVNGTRLVVSSAFTTTRDGLALDGRPLTPPYRITVVGPPDAIGPALEIPGGAVDTLESREGVATLLLPREELVVPARDEPPRFEVGRPLPPATVLDAGTPG